MINPIKEIHAWQKAAGNLDKPYDDFLESSFQVEEALEGFPQEGLDELAKQLSEEYYEPQIPKPKNLSRTIVHIAQNGYFVDEKDKLKISDVDRLDKACDAIVFAIGSMAKLGLDHHGVTKALNIVNQANKQKLGMERDAEGKLLKPAYFEGPEPKLQALLDSYK